MAKTRLAFFPRNLERVRWLVTEPTAQCIRFIDEDRATFYGLSKSISSSLWSFYLSISRETELYLQKCTYINGKTTKADCLSEIH